LGEVKALRCVTCGTEYDERSINYTCPACGLRRGTLEVIYDYDRIERTWSRNALANDPERTMWRFLPLLPVRDRTYIQPLRVGCTPAYRFTALGERIGGLAELVIKDDGQNPTASYKDRASSVVVIKAQERGESVVTCASTGNAASSLSGFAAATPLEAVIFVPRTAPEAKVAQLLIYGARVFLVRGSYDDAYDLASEAAEAFGWYNRSAAMNPFLVEGKKTGALELAEQFGWNVPDVVFVAVGDGSVISGICKGFEELRRLNWIDRLPRVIGVQAEGSCPVAAAFERSPETGDEVDIVDVEAETVADSICVGKPRDIVKAVRYVRRNGGGFVCVTDAEILDGLAALARETGVFAEPAGATAYAGVKKLALQGELAGKRVAAMITGNGLKDIASARRVAGSPTEIDASIEALRREL